MENLTGETLGQFEIKQEIGRGGMATVYKAHHRSMNRTVAIKILPPQMLNDPRFYERFKREMDVIARLEHPYILPVYDYGQAAGLPYIAMRYLGGGNLEQRILRSSMKIDEIEKPLRQVAQALDYAYHQGIVHRDIKPSNIILDENDNAYLTDFGIAGVLTMSSDLTGGTIVGTPAYMSPEQWMGASMDGRSDIYSLGIILFEWITGQKPYQAETPYAVMHQHFQEQMPSIRKIRADVPQAVEDVILKATAKDPNNRYSSAGEFAQAYANAIKEYVSSNPAPHPKLKPVLNIPKLAIFVSYKRDDRQQVEQIITLLRKMGHDVWYDQHISGGQKWWDKILEEIRNATLFMTVISPLYLESYPCQLEYQYAHALNKRILPIEISRIEDYRFLPSQLQEYNIIQAYEVNNTLVDRLNDGFSVLKPVVPMPDPLPTPPPAPISELSKLNDRVQATELGSQQDQLMLVTQLETYLLGDMDKDRAFAYQILKDLQMRRDIMRVASDKIARLLVEYEKQTKGGLWGRFKRPRP